MKTAAHISRFLLGATFVFSGFVKAVDPWGSQFKFEDYFIAFGWNFMIPLSLTLGIIMAAAEFLIGAALLTGIKPRLSSLGALLFMCLFTPLTFYLALTNAVSDCGCFGDAVKLSNWNTFYKNIFILALAVFIFLYRKKFKHYMSCRWEWLPVGVFVAGILFVSFWGLRHLPVIDFLPYKVGVSMKPDPNLKDKYFVTYKDKRSGQAKEYPADNFPWQDSLWMANNEFVSQRVEKAATPPLLINVMNAENVDVTDSVMLNPGVNVLVVSYNMNAFTQKAAAKVMAFTTPAQKGGMVVSGLTATLPENADSLRHVYQLDFPFYSADDITLKMLVRANPAIVIMKDGTILKKWAWRDVPAFSDVDFKALEASAKK